MKKVKKQASISSFSYFTWEIPFQAKSSGCTNIARKTTFEGHLGPKFCPVWVKNGKKLIIFKNFTLVSLKVTKFITI